jgi:hypothetical protein
VAATALLRLALGAIDARGKGDAVSTPRTTGGSGGLDGKAEAQISGLPLNVPVVVTEQIGSAAAAAAPTNGGAPSAIIERQLRNILGWAPKPADTSGLVRALEKSFSSLEERGVTRWYYTPRGTAIPLDAAEVTGAQGSLYLRAKGTVDDMLVLLKALEPMREEAADEDAVEAIRAIVRYTVSAVVDEIGREGGPSVPLIDSYFEQLLGIKEPADPVETDPTEVDGDVGRLRDRFYFDRQFISGLPDETNFTKFLTFVDFATSLRSSWELQRVFFAGEGDEAFFGPQLTKLRRILGTLGRNVEEVYVALDAVGIDQTERDTLETDSLFLQPTLDWVQGYVTETAPRLVEEAGVDGARSLLPNLAAMADAVDKFIPPVDGFPTLYNTPLVFAALQSLQRGLVEAAEIVDQIGTGPGAHEITLREETVPPVEVPDPDETEAPPIVATVEWTEHDDDSGDDSGDGGGHMGDNDSSRGGGAPDVEAVDEPAQVVEARYVVSIRNHREEDEYELQHPDDVTKTWRGQVLDRFTCLFVFPIVDDEPPRYNILRLRPKEKPEQIKTIPTATSVPTA